MEKEQHTYHEKMRNRAHAIVNAITTGHTRLLPMNEPFLRLIDEHLDNKDDEYDATQDILKLVDDFEKHIHTPPFSTHVVTTLNDAIDALCETNNGDEKEELLETSIVFFQKLLDNSDNHLDKTANTREQITTGYQNGNRSPHDNEINTLNKSIKGEERVFDAQKEFLKNDFEDVIYNLAGRKSPRQTLHDQ